VADDAKTPVAIRITRPYDNEDAFLARELDTVTKTSIVLLGAQPRPQGVVLRFELALATGVPLVRGEGRVVAYKERAFEDSPGLTLRFTRLDSRSKALVDKAAAMRDARSRPSQTPLPRAPSLTPPEPMSPASPPAPPAPPESSTALSDSDLELTHAEAPRAKSNRPPPLPPSATGRPPARPASRFPPPLPPPVIALAPAPPSARSASGAAFDLESTHAEAPRSKRSELARDAIAPPDRDDLLQRLRVRAKTLDEDQIRAILDKPKR
jgi:hypothetical protein